MDKFIETMILELRALAHHNPGKNIIILLGLDEREKLEEWYHKEIHKPGQQHSNLYKPFPGDRTFYGYMLVFTAKPRYKRYVTDIKL